MNVCFTLTIYTKIYTIYAKNMSSFAYLLISTKSLNLYYVGWKMVNLQNFFKNYFWIFFLIFIYKSTWSNKCILYVNYFYIKNIYSFPRGSSLHLSSISRCCLTRKIKLKRWIEVSLDFNCLASSLAQICINVDQIKPCQQLDS